MLDRPISVTIEMATRLTGITRNQLYDAVNNGQIDTAFIGKRRVVLWASLEKYIESKKAKISPAASERLARVRAARTAKGRGNKVAA